MMHLNQALQVFLSPYFSGIDLYLDLHQNTKDWQAVVIFPNRGIEPKNQYLYRANLNSDQFHRIYLDDLNNVPTESLGVGLMQLIQADTVDAVTQAQSLLTQARSKDQTDSKIAAIIELIETIIVYKFPQLSREEIEHMLGLSELRETKVYQEALQEGEVKGRQEGEQTGILKGRQEGKLEGEQALILRQLTRRIGKVAPELLEQVQALSLAQLEALGEALLDFSKPSDLMNWLQRNEST